jgi:hypothetical protein
MGGTGRWGRNSAADRGEGGEFWIIPFQSKNLNVSELYEDLQITETTRLTTSFSDLAPKIDSWLKERLSKNAAFPYWYLLFSKTPKQLPNVELLKGIQQLTTTFVEADWNTGHPSKKWVGGEAGPRDIIPTKEQIAKEEANRAAEEAKLAQKQATRAAKGAAEAAEASQQLNELFGHDASLASPAPSATGMLRCVLN